MDTNTSIMYEGSAVSQYSTWELHCSWAGKDKSSKSSVSVEILTHPTGLHHSVICWMFSKKVTAFDGLARVFHVFWDYIFLFLFFVIVLLYDKDKQMHWVSFMLDLCCVYGVKHFQYFLVFEFLVFCWWCAVLPENTLWKRQYFKPNYTNQTQN